MEQLKGLILSGGKGTRLRPITHTSAKQLVPVANKPVLFYGIEALAQAGIDQIGVIIAPETGDEIRSAAGDGSAFHVHLHYIVQEQPLGLAHAVLTAQEFLSDSPFVMYLGDNLLQGGIVELVNSFRAQQPHALILLTPVSDPSSYGIAEIDSGSPSDARDVGGGADLPAGPCVSRRVVRLVEKPQDPQSDLALVGVYMFSSAIHHAARAIRPSRRGELEITDAIQHMVDSRLDVRAQIVEGWWKDTGRVQDMLEANRLVLDNLSARVEGQLVDSTVEGRVVIEEHASLHHVTVRGPAIIGAHAVLRDCYIGPYTAVGERCTVVRAEVEHSILLQGASVCELDGRIESSLLGRNVTVGRGAQQPKAYRLLVGDNSQISIP